MNDAIDLKSRVIFDNIFLLSNDEYILLNLYSFRRMCVSKADLCLLFSYRNKIEHGVSPSEDESDIYKLLVGKRQILSKDIIEKYKYEKSKQYTDVTNPIRYKVNNVTISPTFSCNFNCVYCYQKKLPQQIKGFKS